MVPLVTPQAWYLDLADSTMAPRCREEFERYLRRHGDPDGDYLSAELIFGELVWNAVRYAPGPIEVSVDWPDGRAVLHVSDDGYPVATDVSEAPDPYAPGGRGLLLVNRLSDGFSSTVYADRGKTLSATLPVHARQPRHGETGR
jgi:anti-sigma regulatory factor (Ser/Thr protein kinase)